MGKRASYLPGTFSWVDLATTDAAVANAFYTGLFGWEADDSGSYTTFRNGGDVVAGLRHSAAAPPGWLSYVTVAGADAVAARAAALGGHVIGTHSDGLDGSPVAVLADPQGAVLAVRQPRDRIGAERVNDVGCLCMNELLTTRLEPARSFYAGLFGWTTQSFGPEMMLALNEGRINASFAPVRNGADPHWRACFSVESAHAALERVRELGGQAAGEPIEIPDGSLAVARDPQGAVFALFAGDTHP